MGSRSQIKCWDHHFLTKAFICVTPKNRPRKSVWGCPRSGWKEAPPGGESTQPGARGPQFTKKSRGTSECGVTWWMINRTVGPDVECLKGNRRFFRFFRESKPTIWGLEMPGGVGRFTATHRCNTISMRWLEWVEINKCYWGKSGSRLDWKYWRGNEKKKLSDNQAKVSFPWKQSCWKPQKEENCSETKGWKRKRQKPASHNSSKAGNLLAINRLVNVPAHELTRNSCAPSRLEWLIIIY